MRVWSYLQFFLWKWISALKIQYIGHVLQSEWLMFNAKWPIFQLYHGENKLIFNEMMMRSALYLTKMWSWIFIVLALWNNSLWVNIMLHSETLSWFKPTSLWTYSLNTSFIVFGLTRPGLKLMIYNTDVLMFYRKFTTKMYILGQIYIAVKVDLF
jgi:hypothetical protein